ncbi:MAG TPA: hypothetical protein VJX67_27165, partial [Blastocatellia bacterium]|nr:hypothetical protein [Blastocatellia bacterium]
MKSPLTIYSGITGDSKMLAAFSESGQLVRLFWPHIDYGQHMEEFRAALILAPPESPGWLDRPGWSHRQEYQPGTNSLTTFSRHEGLSVAVEATAYCPPGEDCLIIDYRIVNEEPLPRRIQFAVYECFRINESAYYTTAMMNEGAGCLVFYHRNVAIALASNLAPSGFHCGVRHEESSALTALKRRALRGTSIQHKSPDGAISWDLGRMVYGESRWFTLFVATGT